MGPDRPLRVLVADDEPLARQRLEDLLAHEPAVEIVATADSGPAAIEAIRRFRPDLVFLDVQMPGATGLDVVAAVGPDRMPATIFVTAYDQHALRAFELSALDYLVKPFDDERFEQAFRRARRLVGLEEVDRTTRRLVALLQGEGMVGTASAGPPAPSLPPAPEVPTTASYLERIAVEGRGEVRVVPVERIDCITANGPYAELHADGRRHLLRERMSTLEERLDPARFLRVHRSVIVRLDAVEGLKKGAGGDYAVRLRGGAELPVSRSRREELEGRLGLGR